jgi:hypothetical protein
LEKFYLLFNNLNYPKSVLILELQSLASHISEWREKQLDLISERIERSINSTQLTDKEKCENARKFHCKVSGYGYGSQIHSLMTCLLNGYYRKTLVVIDEIFGNYLGQTNLPWDQFISPISDTCQPNYRFTYKFNELNQEAVIGRDCK